MITIKAKHWVFSLLASKALLLGVTCSATSVVFAAVETLKPIETVNVQEAAPPWAGADTLLEQAKEGMAAAPANEPQPTEQAAVDIESDAAADNDMEADVEKPAPTVLAKVDEEAVPSTPSKANTTASMENWYRNRHEKSARPTDIGEIQAAAQKGDARAQYTLALRLRTQEGGNISQSLNWQRQAAMGGYAEAQYGLGLLFANGQYLARDTERARDWFQRAAAQGHVAARLALLSLGDSAAPPKVAMVAAPEAAPEPVVEQAPEPVAKPTPKTAPAVPTKLVALAPAKPLTPPVAAPEADVDNVPSVSEGMDLTGVEPAVVKQSAEAGNKNAQLMLGTMYEDGLGGLPVDLRDAAHWYEKAAQQGYPKAQYNLGLLYEDGRGVKQDYKQAAYWYEKAAKSGFTEAQNNLGVLCVLGKGVKKDAKRAKALFSEAAAQGNSNAERNLSMLKTG